MNAVKSRSVVIAALPALMLAVPSGAAEELTIVERNDVVRNVIVVDDRLVKHGKSSADGSGIRIDLDLIVPEAYAKGQAVENRLEGGVQPNRPPALVKGKMDNIIQVDGVVAVKRSDDDKACIEIGTVGGDGDCQQREQSTR